MAMWSKVMPLTATLALVLEPLESVSGECSFKSKQSVSDLTLDYTTIRAGP